MVDTVRGSRTHVDVLFTAAGSAGIRAARHHVDALFTKSDSAGIRSSRHHIDVLMANSAPVTVDVGSQVGSGYLVSASADARLADSFAPFVGSRVPRKWYFGAPLHSGNLEAIEVPLYYTNGKNNSSHLLFELWQVKDAGNPFNDITSADFDLIAVATLDTASVAVGSQNYATWVTIPFGSYPRLDSQPMFGSRSEQQNFALTYAIRATFASVAASTDVNCMAVTMPLNTNRNLHFGVQGRGTATRVSEAFYTQDLPFALKGSRSVSSAFGDFPLGLFEGYNVISASIDLIPTTYFRRGMNFSAVGSAITRAAVTITHDGALNKRFHASTWSDSGGLPYQCVSTSQIVIVNSIAAWPSNFFNGDNGGSDVSPSFVFSSCPVNSGSPYWLFVEVASYVYGLTDSIRMPVRSNKPGQNRYSFHVTPTSDALVEGETLFAEIWYVDSWTRDRAALDNGWIPIDPSSIPPPPTFTGLTRNYPNVGARRYPELTNRKHPL